MQKNDLIVMTAESLGADMEGICRHEGMAVFVPGMLPGETGPVRIVKCEKRYAFGRLERLPETVSADRVQPDCPAYPRCGGCSCRHMTYQKTLEAKRQQIIDCFNRIGHLNIPDALVPPVIGMSQPEHYRNKTALPVGGSVEHPVMGFYAPRSHRIIPAERCPNAMEPSGDVAAAFLAWMRENGVAPYNEETLTGLVRHLVIRVNRKGESMVTAVINGDTLPHREKLWMKLEPLNVVSLQMNINKDVTNVIFGRVFKTLYGRDTLQDVLCGLTFELSAPAFFQVNPWQTEKLYHAALDFADLTPDTRLTDVYCGAGTITLMMARHCKEALGIEIVPQAIENAKENAKRNGISNADFRTGAAEEVLPALVRQGLRPDVIVVDPPRKGLDEKVIHAMAEASPERIVYVSCNVATQARDAALLKECGYRITKTQGVDMFCFTSGVENVCLFEKSL